MTRKQWEGGFYEDEANDQLLASQGKVIEQLSEHQCEGMLEAYVLTGRHGVWSSYESFIHVVDSMVNQHCKWLEATVREIPWRAPIAGLNILLSSHCWRQATTMAFRTRTLASSTCCSTRRTTRTW